MLLRKRWLIASLLVFMMTLGLFPAVAGAAVESTMTLATTTSTQDSGLLDVLIPVFEKDYNTKVKVIAVGSGQAMEMGQRGDADVLLVHSRKAEDEFVAKGFGINRQDVMYNQFLVVGPGNDPAGIKGMTDAKAAFKKIAASQAKFVSRADKSGTHTKELSVWTAAGITPSGKWYIEAGQGMGDTLLMANEMNAYTLTDEATWLSWQSKTDLKEVVRGDKVLFNPYGVIAVNPAKHPSVHKNAANAFTDFITGAKGQGIIATFGADKYGKALFTPDAKKAPSAPSTPATTVSPGKKVTVTASVLNVRSGPGTNYSVLGGVKKGSALEVVASSGQWLQVKYGQGTAYVAGWYVK